MPSKQLVTSAIALSFSAAVLGNSSARAAVIMDQIGTVPSFVTGQGADTSDVFEAANSTFSSAVVDDFTVTGASLLTKVFAVTDGFNTNFVSYSGVTSWDVEIYSSLSAANSSLVGDVYNHTFAPAAVNLTTPFGGSSTSALFNVSTSIILPTAGTYYLAVIANNSFTTNGEIGIYSTTGVTGSNPGNLNDVQENPAGGFGFTGNANPLFQDAAYAIQGVSSVPEPTTGFLIVAAGSILTLSRRKRAMLPAYV